MDGTLANDTSPGCLSFFAYAEDNKTFTIEDIAQYNNMNVDYFRKVVTILRLHGYDLSKMGFVEES